MSEIVRLTIPRTRPYYGVARLVVGGVAARLDLGLGLRLLQTSLAREVVVAGDRPGRLLGLAGELADEAARRGLRFAHCVVSLSFRRRPRRRHVHGIPAHAFVCV